MLIAKAFFEKITKNKALSVMPLNKQDLNKLSSYSWPGNVRELQNIIERGIITSFNGKFNLDSIFPALQNRQDEKTESAGVLTDADILELEKNNIIKALNLTNWKISGQDGAAYLLGLPRTTLASKIKKFGVKRVAIG